MIHTRQVDLVSPLQKFSRASSVLVAALAMVVLAGWVFDVDSLKGAWPGFFPMQANTAFAFLLSAISLWSLGASTTGQRRAGQACAFLVLLIGVVTLAECILGLDFGVDRWLFRAGSDPAGGLHPGRMSQFSTINLILIGLALSLLCSGRGLRWAQLLVLLESLVSMAVWIGYAFGVESFYGEAGRYTPMSLLSATSFLILSLGILCARPGQGLMASVTSPNVGGVMARRMLPASLGIPVLLGWLWLLGFQAMLYQAEFGVALLVVFTVSIFAILVWWSSLQLNRIDRRQRQTEENLKRLNDALESRTAELESVNKELQTFAYSVSHDLRAPLRAIDGFSLAVMENCADKLDQESVEDLQRVRAACQRMAQLIQDLLALSRVTRAEMKLAPVDLSALAQTVVDDLRKANNNRDVEISIAPDLSATSDAALMRIALENLLGNAWKFTGKKAVAKIEFGDLDQNGQRTFFIRDNGAGFDMVHADKLFVPFQRLHKPGEFEGTGIGLATTQRIIRRHGGRLWAEAAVEKGATFYFTLPAQASSRGV